MPNLKDIRKRIGSVKNTQKITRAMKMVAAARLRRAQDRLVAARPYSRRMTMVIESLAARVEGDVHPLLEARERRDNVLMIVVSSNRGLCGGFNGNLFRAVDHYIADRKVAGEKISIVPVGRKAQVHYGRGANEVVRSFPDIIGDVSYKKAKELAGVAIEGFVGADFDAVYICYNQFVSAINYNSLVRPLLPLSLHDLTADAPAKPGAAAVDNDIMVAGEYIYEPDVNTLLAKLLPGHVEVQVLQALFESEAAEHGARMSAMESATNNASDMISRLTLQYNRARQAYITREIVEIISGAESLKG
ncbi:MAG: ATP synthase F1 subunit gamma [Bradymonadaceae bacterium]|nr:ATP synthase F1 subunit gamma [Lujinxingiaceae bacterium]